jgi:DNA repair exonuclease SbcCD nuclease subunit
MVKILHTADWQLGKQFENLGDPSDSRFRRQHRSNTEG